MKHTNINFRQNLFCIFGHVTCGQTDKPYMHLCQLRFYCSMNCETSNDPAGKYGMTSLSEKPLTVRHPVKQRQLLGSRP
jgi:hypothetical protein